MCWTEPRLTFDLHNKLNVRLGAVQQAYNVIYSTYVSLLMAFRLVQSLSK